MEFKVPKLPAPKHRIQIPPEIKQSDKEALEVVKILGNGSFGSVSLCRKQEDLFVMKEMIRGDDPHVQKLFLKEATLLQMTDHVNIVKFDSVVVDRSNFRNTLALLLEYVTFDFNVFEEPSEVNSLAHFLRALDEINFVGFEHVSKFIASDVAKGLCYLHRNGIVHRDLKPSNILVSNQHYSHLGKDGFAKYWQSLPVIAKLTDFGESRARLVQTATLHATKTANVARGTLVFMAPEAFSSDRLFSASIEDFKCMDVWSFGMVLFTLLNPDIQYPYQIELKEGQAISQDMSQDLKRLMAAKNLPPRHSMKYDNTRQNVWSNVLQVYETCIQYVKTNRPSMDDVMKMLKTKDESAGVTDHSSSKSRGNRSHKVLQTMESAEAECLSVEVSKDSKLGPLECIELLKSVKDKQELDQHGKEILRVLREDESVLEKDPDILIWLIQKASDLIDSEYYEKIVKVVPYGGIDSPLKYLLGILTGGEENFKKLFKVQKKLMSIIQNIAQYGDDQYRTECLRFISFTRKFSGIDYPFEWSEEYLSTLKELLENGADPTWIHPGYLKKERKDRSTAQNAFFVNIFVNLWEKNDLHESLLRVLPLMLSKKCKDNELLQGTLLHCFVYPRWDYIATNRESMPPDFFRQFKNILGKILRQDGTLLVQKECYGRTPLQLFLSGIKLEERIFGEVREIIQMLQSPEVLSSQDDNGETALHSLARYFPVIQGEVSQSGRESFLELVKSFANESNVGCQNINGRTALHYLARKFPGGISEEWREVYQDFVKHLATYDILEIKDKDGRTALHYLAYNFTFEIEDWKMETFVEVLKCLAVPRTICIKNKKGETALEIITRKWGKKVPEHYKDKYEEISDILSGK